MKIDALNRPFDASLIKSRPGKGGSSLSYVEGGEYIRRLNEAFDHRWSLRVLQSKIDGDAAIVEVELDVPELGVMKHAFGGQQIRGMDPWDALKAAETDALKKAASMLGIGIHLWCDDVVTATATPPPAQPAQGSTTTATPKDETAPPAHTAERVRGERRQVASPDAPATERQLNAIMAIGRTLGWSSEAIRHHALDAYSVPTNQLTKGQATELIDNLKGLASSSATASAAGAAGERVTTAQLKAITDVSRQLHMKPEHVVERCRDVFKVASPRDLTIDQANELIADLEAARRAA